MRNRCLQLVAGLALSLGLSACSDGEAGKFLGLEKKPPDEFSVVSRAPLTLPPDYGLKPPEPGAPRPQEGTPRGAAENTLFRDGNPRRSTAAANRPAPRILAGQSGNVIVQTPGDVAFLNRVDADTALPDIRQILSEENAILAIEDQELVDYLIFWRDKPPQGTIVDAGEEKRRLQENQALGRSVTEGETPMIERKKKGGSLLPF